jgi:Flp pilus assembly protein TadG
VRYVRNRRWTLRTPSAARPRQRGQAILEFAMFFVFIMLLLAGVTDIAGLLDVHIAVVYASRQGARTGSVMGPVTGSDCAMIGAIHSALLNQPNLTPTQIIIYKATGTTNGVYTTGLPANIYPGSDDCVGGTLTAAAISSTWPETSRNITPFTEDSIGVQITYTYQFQFNLLGTTFSAADYAVCPMNPSGGPTPAPSATPTP